jgi:hypothetical protein
MFQGAISKFANEVVCQPGLAGERHRKSAVGFSIVIETVRRFRGETLSESNVPHHVRTVLELLDEESCIESRLGPALQKVQGAVKVVVDADLKDVITDTRVNAGDDMDRYTCYMSIAK